MESYKVDGKGRGVVNDEMLSFYRHVRLLAIITAEIMRMFTTYPLSSTST